MSKIAQATKEKAGQVKDHVASTLGTSYEKPHKDDEARLLNPKRCELHLNLTLTLIPNQSYAKMHRLCVEYAYAYSYYAYSGISIHEWLDVHTGTSNSRPNMDEHQLLHDRFMLDIYKDEYLKKQIMCMTICICGYYPGSYLDFFGIYPGQHCPKPSIRHGVAVSCSFTLAPHIVTSCVYKSQATAVSKLSYR